jgi:chorismate lyase
MEKRSQHDGAHAEPGNRAAGLWSNRPPVHDVISPILVRLLAAEGLLTGHIETLSGAPVVIQVLGQRMDQLTAEQAEYLATPAERCLVREVLLVTQGVPWVYAQSLIPEYTLSGHPWLATLGSRSLGSTLAGIPLLTRGVLEFARLPSAHPLAISAAASTGHRDVDLWARRSWFAIDDRRLLVQEVFLAEAFGS